MGLTFVNVKVANPADPSRAIEEQFLVDSGAVYSLVPSKELEQIGIEPHSRRSFILANGERPNVAAAERLRQQSVRAAGLGGLRWQRKPGCTCDFCINNQRIEDSPENPTDPGDGVLRKFNVEFLPIRFPVW